MKKSLVLFTLLGFTLWLIFPGVVNAGTVKKWKEKNHLFHAVKEGNIDAVKELLKQGICTKDKDFNGSTVLHHASKRGHTKVLELLLPSCHKIINTKSHRSYSPLHYAAELGLLEVAKILVDAGADLHHTTSTGNTALFLAIKNSHHEVIQFFLEKGAPVGMEATSVSKSYPLITAVSKGDIALVKLMLQHGACVNERNHTGMTPLHVATYKGRKDIMEVLLNYHAEIDAIDVHKRTPMHLASIRGRLDLASYLFTQGAHMDVVDRNGLTPVSYGAYALRGGRGNIIQISQNARTSNSL